MRIGNQLELNTDMKSILDKLILDLRAQGSTLFSKGYKDTNGYLSVQCPYHKMGMENHPSAQFRQSDGLFYCFGCKESHSLMSVIEHCLGVNGRAWLLENFAGEVLEQRQIKFNLPQKKEKPTYISKDILKQFRFTHQYMFDRKLTMDVIRKFDIGYDKEFILITENSGKVVKRKIGECITFPVKDEFGNIVFIARRAIHQKFFHYPQEIDKPLYGLYEIYREMKHGIEVDEVYVCESMLDALRLWSVGKYAIELNVTGSKKQYEMIKNCSLRYFILATDNDDAGRRAREKFKANINNKIIRELDYSSYGNCKDVNDMSDEQILNAKVI